MRKLLLFALFLTIGYEAISQVTPCDCTANVSGSQNFSALTWTGSGCPTAGSTSYTGNLCINIGNGETVTMDKDFTITGGLGVTNSGSSFFDLPAGIQLSVSGDMGDDSNNNVSFTINGDLAVGGTFYGKNNNGFTGSGSITAGGLEFGNNTTCSSPANCSGIDWNVGSCTPSGSTFCTNVNALPVTLLFFEGKVVGETVELTWATATESNSSYFSIERSTDGKTFNELARVDAAGNSLSRKEYELIDRHPIIGRVYYRLKQVDFDGTMEFFNVRFVDLEGRHGIVIYPNPVNNNEETTLSLNFSSDEKSYVRITDLAGREIREFSFSGTETILPAMPGKGTYLIRVFNTTHAYVTRFIVP